MRAVRHWHREAVAALFLEMFEVTLDEAISNLVLWEVSLSLTVGWTEVSFNVRTCPQALL